MGKYGWMYRLGYTPWERYGPVALAQFGRLLDREAGEQPPAGRALDLGCGRGRFTRELARRGWDAVGIDAVPQAVSEAESAGGADFRVADVTRLESEGLGSFSLFLDCGCFQGLGPEQRTAEGRGVTALAEPGAVLLLLAFGDSKYRRMVEGASPEEVAAGFPDWELTRTEAASTEGMGWPMDRTAPQWYRFQYPAG
ncbi:class I SAM-dependent methyltransferase [Nocardiopsis coralliicola]